MLRYHRRLLFSLYFSALIFIGLSGPGPGTCADQLTVVKIASQDQSALVRMPDGTLKVIHVGDVLPSLGKVRSISEGRIATVTEKNVTFLVLLKNGKQVVRKIDRAVPADKSGRYPSADRSDGTTAGSQAGRASEGKESGTAP